MLKRELTNRDKVLLAILALSALFYIIYTFGYKTLQAERLSLQNQLETLKGRVPNIKQLQLEEQNLDNRIREVESKIQEAIQNSDQNAINKQDFLRYVSHWASSNNVKVAKFKNLSETTSNGVWRSKYEIHLKGTLSDLVTVVNKINDLGISYNVLSMSLRQDLDMPWLTRAYDTQTDLNWMNYKELLDSGEIEGLTEEDLEKVIDSKDLEDLFDIPDNTNGNSNTQNNNSNENVVPEQDTKTDEEEFQDGLSNILSYNSIFKPSSNKIALASRGILNDRFSSRGALYLASANNTSTQTTDKNISIKSLEEVKENLNGELTLLYRLDFEIELIMYKDPSTSHLSSTMMLVDKETEKDTTNSNVSEFVIDKSGSTMSKIDIDKKASKDKSFITDEINRVSKEMANMKKENLDTTELNKYLQYLKSFGE